jgi:hypothetical protein
LSADPNSFHETNFHSPRFQLFNRFTSDYQRVGPEINGNILVNNSTNGLFVSILTPAGNQVRKLTVPARFDDTDVVHVIAENLEIQGTPGAPFLDTSRPPINVVGLSPRSGGSLPPARFNYKVVFFDVEGFEGRPSEATSTVQLVAGQGSIQITNLPPSTSEFIGRRLYRSSAGGAGPYHLVAELNSSDTTFIDNGSVTGPQLQNDPLSVLSTALTIRPGGTLTDGSYNYRVTYVDANGVEGPASDATVTAQVNASSGNRTVRLTGVPTTAGLERRIYRSSSDGATPYTLVRVIPAALSGLTTVDDNGTTLGIELDLTRIGVLRARSDARLRIDAGIIVKLEAARIEASFGSQFIAEGRADRPIIFTSTLDDRFGAGGTFDTANDGTSEQPARGDWGGIFVGQSAEASIDHALLTFGGGDTRIEGNFVHFNVIEVHQANMRLAHSVIEENADGIEAVGGPDPDRIGRGLNEPATIFLRGTQPVLLENVIRDNEAQAITIDVNSFIQDLLDDPGRTTGAVDASEYPDNVGPLVRGNILQDNPNNGLTIRRGILTSHGVFDDTDIVHVLFEEIVIPNFHTYGGLRIQSSSSENLVLKLGGGSRDTFDPRLVSSDPFQPHLTGPTATGVDLTSIEDGIVALYRRAFFATAGQSFTRLTNLDGSVVYNLTGAGIIMIVAVIKASLVAAIFMHLKYDWGKLYCIILPVCVVTVMMVIILSIDTTLAWHAYPESSVSVPMQEK